MKKIFLIICFSTSFQKVFGQDSEVAFFEPITNDSAIIFFNERFHMVNKSCAQYKRFTKIDVQGNFHGSFEDYTIDSVLIGRGVYNNGIKQGNFEIYYPNGKKRCSGSYEKNKPFGEWKFYHENGSEERTVFITNNEILLIRMVDKKGYIMVEDGTGEFEGFIHSGTGSNVMIFAKGKVSNGKPDGKWKSYVGENKIGYCNEVYENGYFIKGIFPNAVANKEYKDIPILNNFFLTNYCEPLEYFIREHCSEQALYKKQKELFNINSLKYDIGERISKVIQSDIRQGNIYSYDKGDHYFSLQFKINEKGIPDELVQISGWGQQFASTLKTSLVSHTKFAPISGLMYFHLKIHFNDSYTYGFSFSISGNRNYE